MHRFTTLAALCCLFAIFGAGCGGVQPTTHTDVTPSERAASGIPVDVGPAVARYLPATVSFALELESMRSVHSAVEIDRFRTEFPDAFEAVTTEAQRLFGRDMTDLAMLERVGVDVDGPFGAAAMTTDGDVWILYGRLADAEKAFAEIEAEAVKMGGKVERETRGDATVLQLSGFPRRFSGYFVARDGWLFMTISKAAINVVEDYVDYLATSDGTHSLDRVEAYGQAWRARGESSPDRLGHVWIATGQMTREVVASLNEELAKPRESYAQTQLEEARARGDFEGARYWEEEVRNEVQYQQSSIQRQRRTREFLLAWVAPLGALVGEVRATEGGSFELALLGHVPDAESALASLAGNDASPPSILTTAAPTAGILGHAHFSADALRTLVDTMLTMNGASLDEAAAIAMSEVEVDLRALLDEIDGSVGAQGWLESYPTSDRDVEESFGFTLTFGISDASPFIAAMERVVAHPVVFLLSSRDGTAPRWKINVPTWRAIWVDVGASSVTISTRERLEPGDASPAATWLADADPRAGTWLQDLSFFVVALQAFGSFGYGQELYDYYPDAPESQTSLERRALYETALAAQASDLAAVGAEEEALMEAIIAAGGETAMRVERTDDGFALRIRWFPGAGGIATSIGTLHASVAAFEALGEARNEIWERHRPAIDAARNDWEQARYQDSLQRTP